MGLVEKSGQLFQRTTAYPSRCHNAGRLQSPQWVESGRQLIYRSMMRFGLGMFGLAAFAVVGACNGPTHDQATLTAVKSEAETLMRSHAHGSIPKADWPPTIAGLKPDLVTVYPQGVEIIMNADFDGGHGYFALREGQRLPDPQERYSIVDDRLYRFRPY